MRTTATSPLDSPKDSKIEILDDSKTSVKDKQWISTKIFDFTKDSKMITGKKAKGEAPGLNFREGDTCGMFKFSKYLLPSKNLLKTIKSPDHRAIIQELLAMVLFRQFFNTSDMEMATVIASKNQLTQTPEKGPLAEYKAGDEKRIFFALKINFAQGAKTIEEAQAIAGNHQTLHRGIAAPIAEGKNANRVLGSDFGLFHMLNFIAQDPDSMGKDGQNKMLIDTSLFIIDTVLNPSNVIQMRKDGSLFNDYYKQRNTDSVVGWGRHLSFRNLSLTDDTAFIDKLEGLIKLLNSKEQLSELFDNLIKQISTIFPKDDPAAQEILRDFQQCILEFKSLINTRITALKTTFNNYINLYKEDKAVLAATIALEQLLSTSSRMYSQEGIPLRAVEIPYQQHFFLDDKITIDNKFVMITLDPQNLVENLKIYDKMKLILGNEIKFSKSKISCPRDKFIQYATEERVRLLTHPETVSLKAALAPENKDIKVSYSKDFYHLLRSYSPDFSKKIEKFASFLADIKNGSDNTCLKYLAILENMYLHIQAELPKNLLTTTQSSTPPEDWGTLIAAQAKIIKKQQFILNRLLAANENLTKILNSKSILDLFANADLLDISHSLNELLQKACLNPKLFADSQFIEVINKIISIKLPITDFVACKQLAMDLQNTIELGILSKTSAAKIPEESTPTSPDDKTGPKIATKDAVILLNLLADDDKARSAIIQELLDGMHNYFKLNTSDINPTKFMDQKIYDRLDCLAEELSIREQNLDVLISKIRSILVAQSYQLDGGLTKNNILDHLHHGYLPKGIIPLELQVSTITADQMRVYKLNQILQDRAIFKAYVESFERGTPMGAASKQCLINLIETSSAQEDIPLGITDSPAPTTAPASLSSSIQALTRDKSGNLSIFSETGASSAPSTRGILSPTILRPAVAASTSL